MKNKNPNPNDPIFFIFSETKWDEMPRMRHYISLQISRFYKVIYIELYKKGKFKSTQINENLTLFSLGGYLKGISKIYLFKIIFDLYQLFLIRKIIRKISNIKILINFKFDFISLYRIKNFKLNYLFINDDFINMNPNASSRRKKLHLKNLKFSANKSYRIFTSSYPLKDDLKLFSKKISVVLSGHDFKKEYNQKKLNNGLINICYLGFLTNNIEIDWLNKLSNLKDISLNFVGPIEDKKYFKELTKKNSVKFHGPMQGKKLQEFISKFDLFIIPYKLESRNTKVSVPGKLFQYLACGRPVVTAGMHNLIEFPPKFIYNSKNIEEFIRNIYKAKEEDTYNLYLERIKFANKYNWDNVGNNLKDIFSKDINI